MARRTLGWLALFAGVYLNIAAAGTCGPTAFQGEAHVPQGRRGCQQMCASQGMYLAGMVYMGEYSDGCICSVEANEQAMRKAVAGAGPAAVGVVTQMRAAEAQRQQNAQMHAQP